ncbi:MAG: hypothetical protein L6R40_000606 [Gallowayella cf. fulva]|nr:MAG: hypothetical protein L6R40_000606 [Xanthomendoza cf. fulva]
MPSRTFKIVNGEKMATLAMERELERRAIAAGLAPSPPVVKLTAAQASIVARKERALDALGPKVAAAIRHKRQEEERRALQLRREQRERQASAVDRPNGTARKSVAWAACVKQVHVVESYKRDNRTVGLRYTVDDEHLDMRYSVDRAAGWISPSTNRGVHKIRAPGWQSVDGYQSMPDDWRDAEDIEAEMETF